jgi:very-short-patch-repair endonuclease/restriction endonuclease S subunit
MIDKIHEAKTDYKLLGNYIQPVVGRNNDLGDLPLVGLSIQKKFIPSIANTIGTDMTTYRIIKRNQFAYGPVTSRNGEKITIALFEDYDEALISQAYIPFEVKDKETLLPEYLMMWFRRPEFDRYARFMSHGSAREIFAWEDMCNVLLPVPSIETQRKIVAEYKTVEDRINLNNKLIQKLEETAQAIYREWFVEFEFPFHSPPLEGCPQDGVVKMPDHTGMFEQDGVVNIPDHTGMPYQDGVVNMLDQPGMLNQNTVVNFPDQPEQQDTPKLKRNSINYFSLPYNPALRQRARELRKAGNLAEVLFWKQVRNKSFKGLDFDRQKIIGNYIVDFYCPNCQVVVEIDGASHNDKQEYDAKRDEFLQSIGLTVFHFTDYEVKENIDAVMSFLDKHPALNVERLSDSQDKDGVDKVCQQVTQGVSAGSIDQQLTQGVSAGNFDQQTTHSVVAAGSFDHPVLRTPLQRRGISQVGYKSSGGKMVWCEELGKEVPEGWEISNLDSEFNITIGRTPPRAEEEWFNSSDESIDWVSIKDMANCDTYIFTTNERLTNKAVKRFAIPKIPNNTTILSFKMSVGKLAITTKEMLSNEAIAHFGIKSDSKLSSEFIYCFLNSFKFNALGTTSSIVDSINTKMIKEICVLIPQNESVESFQNMVSKIFSIKKVKEKENQKLTELKDLLLSKLATIA